MTAATRWMLPEKHGLAYRSGWQSAGTASVSKEVLNHVPPAVLSGRTPGVPFD